MSQEPRNSFNLEEDEIIGMIVVAIAVILLGFFIFRGCSAEPDADTFATDGAVSIMDEDSPSSLDEPAETAIDTEANADAADSDSAPTAVATDTRTATERDSTADASPTAAATLPAPIAADIALQLEGNELAIEQGRAILNGTGTPGSDVEILVNGALVGTAVVGADGTFTYPLDLDEGTGYDIALRGTDADGNAILSEAVTVAAVANAERDDAAAADDADAAAADEPAADEDDADASAADEPTVDEGDADANAADAEADTDADASTADEADAAEETDATDNTDADASTDADANAADEPAADADADASASDDAAADADTDADEADADAGATAVALPIIASGPESETVEPGDIALSGTAAPNEPVAIMVNGSEAATVTADADGNWNATVALRENGEYAIEARTVEGVSESMTIVVDAPDILTRAADTDEFSTVVAAVGAAGLTDTLAGDGPFTVFAPTNAAFTAVPQATVDALLANPERLAGLLQYHVVSGDVNIATLAPDSTLTAVNGAPITVTNSGDLDAPLLNGSAIVGEPIVASNGVIYPIDRILLPPLAEAIAPPVIDDSGVPVFEGYDLTVVGTAEPGSIIVVTLNGVVHGTAVADETGFWAAQNDVTPGDYEIIATMLDAAELPLARSAPVYLTVQ